MSRIVIFGAGGRAGRRAVAEARRRGHNVTAVVRDPARYTGPEDSGVQITTGDVTDTATVAELSAGHDAAINAAAVVQEADAFFTNATKALVTALPQAGVNRLIAIGLASLLPGPDGTRLLDTPGSPAQFRPFCLAHAAGLEILRTEGGALDWLYISPAGDFDHEGERTGRYDIRAHGDMATRISYPDFAVTVLDEIDTPRHHRQHLAVT
ncbi:NAD(P)-dependent oxidoreductase [Nocardia donostiensis]|uniref:NAD-binding protein n=1 Tax=Nocardia donostiensis TaxID=1538463 RepID=A0A1V2T9K4_9NOCA|nr:NAD(P)H-binding protein [Nocardia donostiensis]ONM46194.1 NAD-binding protein [Nocardia donostiensis]OQS14914.1 NAD-binding protein [Nocardia donostiensis]OQS18244.1 NAD-binding protein [Nocardia donostiensis]